MNLFRSLPKTLILGTILSSQAMATGWVKNDNNDPAHFNVNYKKANWHPTNYTYQFSQMPLAGSVANENIPWSDSYWPSQRGSMAYRWKKFQDENMDQNLSLSDRKRLFFGAHLYSKDELKNMSQDQIAQLSPLEKYSIYTKDYGYSLMDKYSNSSEASKAYWMGYCHDWTPVALHYPEPLPVTVTNSDGITIPFGSADVKAIMISAYQTRFNITPGRVLNTIFSGREDVVRYVGTQSSVRFQYPKLKVKKGVEMFGDEESDTTGVMAADYGKVLEQFQSDANRLNFTPDGGPSPRDPQFVQKVLASMKDANSQDVNAGAFHIVVANQLGLMKEGFAIDKTPDMEVWNQPAFKFTSTLVGYEDVKYTSAAGTKRTAHLKTRLFYADDTDYGWAFWNPTLLSLFSSNDGIVKGLMDSFMSEFNRYSKLLMNEGDITTPSHYPEGIIDYADYEYTLDLDANNNIIGGDWLTFDHPDRLWIQKKAAFEGKYAALNQIYQPVNLPADQAPNYGDEEVVAAPATAPAGN